MKLHAKVKGFITSLRGRLFGGFGIVLMILVVLVSSALVSARRSADSNNLNTHSYEVLRRLDQVRASLLNMETGERGYALTGRDGFLDPYKQGQADFEDAFAKLKALTADNPAQQQRLAVLKTTVASWQSDAEEPSIALRRQIEAGEAGRDGLKRLLAFAAEGRGKVGMDAMRKLLTEMEDAERVLRDQRSAAANRIEAQTRQVLTFGGLGALVLGIFLAWLIARSVLGPVARAVGVAEAIADGKLGNDIVVDRQDEVGTLLKAMRRMDEKLCEIVGTVRSGAGSVGVAANQLAQGNEQLSQRTQEQASSLEETASSMEEMTSTVKQSADNAGQASQLASGARVQAERGGEVAARASAAMGEIQSASRQITDIVQLIDEIAFQTNLLSLNAAVEAARAGEQGRGFAVVASEVRSLAQRSAGAAKEIKALIGDSVEKVKVGSALVEESGQALAGIIESVKRVTDIVAEIAAASQEQSSGIDQVNHAVMQMDEVTQQNAALVEEAAAAARAMQEQAQTLSRKVQFFRIAGAAGSEAVPVMAPEPQRALPGEPAHALAPVLALRPATAGAWSEF